MNSTYENKNETNIDYSGYKHKPRNELTFWRYQNGKYNDRPIDPDYQIKYYRLKSSLPVACKLCGCVSVISQMNRHQRSKTCLSFQKVLNENMEHLQAEA